MVTTLQILLAVVAFATMFYVSVQIGRPLAWRLFRCCHKNDPDALAFADRKWPKGKRW